MPEKPIPWWRRALNLALGGIRSGFGLFSRPVKIEPNPEPGSSDSFEEAAEEETALPNPSPQPAIAAAEPAVQAGPPVEHAPTFEPATDQQADAPPVAAAALHPETEPILDTEPEALQAEAPSEALTDPAEEPEAGVTPEPENIPEPQAEESEAAPIPEQETTSEPEAEESPDADAASEQAEEAEAIVTPEQETIPEPGFEETPQTEAASVPLAEPVEAPEAIAVPEPETITEPVAEETPQTEAASEPVVEPAEELEAIVTSEPETIPEPPAEEAPQTEAASEPVVEPVEEPQPEAAPMPGNTETTDAEAVDETFPELLDVAEAEPVPSPEPSVAPEPEAMNESVSEPIESAEPAVEAEPEAAETPDTENQSESVPEPDEAAETMNETVPEPVESEKEEHAVAEAEPEAVGALEAEFASEPLPVLLEETEPAPETGPEITPEPISAPGIEEAPPDANPPISEACADSDSEPPAAAEPEPAIAPEPAAEPVPEPAPVVDSAAYLVLTTQPTADEKAAARLAARQKKLDESAEQSPFSVIVGQVYDGPLDLLLDLIRKQDIDIYDIPIARITAQFLAYVNQLRASDVDVAGEFIYTASLLIHIKSKMLLPRAETGPEEAAEDPRRELVERLLEHERFKNAAQMLQQKQMLEAASWSNPGAREFKDDAETEPELAADTVDLVRIFREILERARKRPVLDISEDSVTVGQMIQFLARRLTMEDKPLALRRLLSHTRSERALIAMFLALLELVRLQAILLRQDRQFSEIFIKKHSGFDALMNEGLGNARDDWR